MYHDQVSIALYMYNIKVRMCNYNIIHIIFIHTTVTIQ